MRIKSFGIVMLAGMVLCPPAMAQSNIEGRVDRLEREMRAVQRKVFPGGNGQYFPPDISPQNNPGTPAPGSPASTPVADLNGRISAVESQLTTLTGQIEQNQYRLQQFEEAFAAYKRTTDARLKALEDTASAPGGAAMVSPPATTTVTPAARPVTPAATRPATPVAVDPARAQLVAAVEKPSTADPADDLYVYGFRLWQAKLYPEAQSQLKQVVSKYPTNRRASWAQNLLGRSYLDEGKPSLASLAFYENYKKFPDGERAPDSLFFLTVALKKLGKPSADICQVYDELSEVYATRITAQMKADIARGRVTEKCKAA